jgi:hypothetical protein
MVPLQLCACWDRALWLTRFLAGVCFQCCAPQRYNKNKEQRPSARKRKREDGSSDGRDAVTLAEAMQQANSLNPSTIGPELPHASQSRRIVVDGENLLHAGATHIR